jgi:hypothetical protein
MNSAEKLDELRSKGRIFTKIKEENIMVSSVLFFFSPTRESNEFTDFLAVKSIDPYRFGSETSDQQNKLLMKERVTNKMLKIVTSNLYIHHIWLSRDCIQIFFDSILSLP